jgi:Family of unknown function (DUF6282)
MRTLSWDLHIHPGPPEEGRWGDGEQVRRAAQRAGVAGFVWKSHRGTGTHHDCQSLPHSPPYALPSITLNVGVTAADLERALEMGVRWIWGPSRLADGSLGWELPLPEAWPKMRQILVSCDKPLVVSTSHLGAGGRQEVAELAGSSSTITCSVTHSLDLLDAEVRALAALSAVFEADLYTMFNPVRQSPRAALPGRAQLCWSLGTALYLTSDAGQMSTGDPYQFVADCLSSLALGPDMREQLAVAAPREVAARVFEEARAE